MREFNSCILSGKLPVNPSLLLISIDIPGSEQSSERIQIRYSMSSNTLASKCR